MRILRYKILDSAQIKAKEITREKPEPWLVILAQEQTAGYGRKKSFWFSPKGGLYFSVILPKSKIEDLQILTILAAFNIAKLIKDNFYLETFIKVPNDVWIKGKKVAGILTENVIGKEVKLSVMGIGLNTNIEKFPKDLENIATSLKIELGRKVDNEKILRNFLKVLKEQLKTISQ